MTRQYDDYDSSLFVIAMLSIISRGTDRYETSEANVTLSTGAHGFPAIRKALGQEAVEVGKSVVLLEFTTARNDNGPATVAVLCLDDGAPASWVDCAVWSPKANEGLLVAKDGSCAFELNGGELVRLAAPSRRALRAGFARGRRELAIATKRLKVSQRGLDVERIATIKQPTPAEHCAVTSQRLADRIADDMGRLVGRLTDEPSFTLEIGDELLIRLVSGRVTGIGGSNDPLCLLRVQPGDLMPFMIWLGGCRELWQGWWLYGKSAGAQALGKRIGALRRETGGEAPDAFDVDLHSDWMGVNLVAEFPGRSVTLGSHRFARAGEATAFRNRYRYTDNVTRWSLFEAACLLERRDLTRLIEVILERGSVVEDADATRPPTMH